MTDFGKRLQIIMSEKGVKASELSRDSGVGKSMISYYLSGKCLAKQDKVFQLAKALDVDPGWLMTGVEPEKKELKMDLQWFGESEQPKSPEARILAKGIDSMPPSQREAILNMMMGLYPNVFKKGNEDDDT